MADQEESLVQKPEEPLSKSEPMFLLLWALKLKLVKVYIFQYHVDTDCR